MLGAAFKPDSDDVRDSPALSVAAQMSLQGAEVVVTDPRAVENARARWPDLKFASSAEEAAADAELVLLLTEWPEYVAIDPHELGAVVRRRRILDGRNALDPRAVDRRRLDLPRPGTPIRAAGRVSRGAGASRGAVILLRVTQLPPTSASVSTDVDARRG